MKNTQNLTERKPRVLWLARELPFPQDMGDKIYSGSLAKALADAGVDVTLVGLQPAGNPKIPSDWPIKWDIVPGSPRSSLRSLFSTMPLVAAAHATPEYREKVQSLAKENWDFVVFDQYGLGWAIPAFQEQIESGESPILVHIAHDHTSSLVKSLYKNFSGSILKRIALWQNYVKTKRFERKIVSSVDLVTAITEIDARKFSQDMPGLRTVVLKPGYSGVVSSREVITEDTPRRVILVGSFKWIVKQENLRQFVAVADPIFAEKNIEFQVVGSMPAAFARELTRDTVATNTTGFVADIEPHFEAARIAVVPEIIGGGFKLKFLDYIFGRMPVATLSNAAAGLPDEVLSAMLCSEDLRQLALDIADLMDRLTKLNAMQETALSEAKILFRWQDRGNGMLKAMQKCEENRSR